MLPLRRRQYQIDYSISMKNFLSVLLSLLIATEVPATPVSPEMNFENEDPFIFPVAGKKANVGSFWGAKRDGGKRKHEGIDIFAKKGTPVLAISDGLITRVSNMPLGGKVVWMRSSVKNWSVYYAHLDEQWVVEGQYVRKGDALGTVGNTGNARTTPPHLHFGIYTNRGAMDPYPHVKNLSRIPVEDATLAREEMLAANEQDRGDDANTANKKFAPFKLADLQKLFQPKASRKNSLPVDVPPLR